MDAVEWAKRGQDLGAGEIVVNSIDRDGTGCGLRPGHHAADHRGGLAAGHRVGRCRAGQPRGDAFRIGATGAITSSMLYSPRVEHTLTVGEMKAQLAEMGEHVRPVHSAD